MRQRGAWGFDIGGTKLAVGVREGEGVEIRKEPVPPPGNPEVVMERMIEILEEMRSGRPLRALGISIGGPLDHEAGVVLNFPHLPDWRDVPLVEILSRRLNLPVSIDNDANLAAFAEYRSFSQRPDPTLPFVYLTLSTGVGGGIIVDGRLLHGVRTGAGELGHITVDPNGPLCLCGNRGCLEQMVSGTNIAAEAGRQVSEDPERGSWLLMAGEQNGGRIRAEEVVEGFRRGDPLSQEIWLRAVEYLAIGLGSIIHVLAPGTIVLGGGVSLAGDDLLNPLRERLENHVFYIPLEKIRLRTATLGHDSSVIGAILAAEELLDQK